MEKKKSTSISISTSIYEMAKFILFKCQAIEQKGNLENMINKYLKELEEWLFKFKMKISIKLIFISKCTFTVKIVKQKKMRAKTRNTKRSLQIPNRSKF
ncbi:hypothetical protein BpHYR1_002898 [Brachionus plicatilis]|uniref:Uncharacterized protein n=1 Tax=Brachionus plicatilis TaxID=10195 RepID=A0A3M7QAP0_BRAPC|nr:hypothetical protein BpHYR1_002898 [Brachionus plicatilis]